MSSSRASKRLHPSFRRALIFALLPLVALAAIVFLARPLVRRVVVNQTESEPRGLYWLTAAALRRGSFVVLDAPPLLAALIAERHYLPPGVRLLKQVVAVAGDQVCTEGDRYVAAGVLISKIAAVDTSGRPLPPPYPFCGVVPPGMAWVAGRGASSLDSRFFGPISLETLTTAEPLWTTSSSR